MLLRFFAFALCALVLEAGTLPIPEESVNQNDQSGQTEFDLSVDVDKTLEKTRNSNENRKSTYHGESTKKEDTNKGDEHIKTNQEVAVDHGSEYKSRTEHSDNDLGHLKKVDFEDEAYKEYSGQLDSTITKGHGKLVKMTQISGETDFDTYGTTSQQNIENGRVDTSDIQSNRSKTDQVVISRDFESHPDANHVDAFRKNGEDFHTSDSSLHSRVSNYEHTDGGNSVSVNNKNDTLSNLDYKSKFSTLKTLKVGPNQHDATATRLTTARTSEDLFKTNVNEVKHKTPMSNIIITDFNQQENKDVEDNYNKESVKLNDDKKGNVTSEHDKTSKDKEETSQKTTNLLTVESKPVDDFSTPFSMVIRAERLDNKHMKSKETNEKQVEKKSPESKKVETYKEVKSDQYDYDTDAPVKEVKKDEVTSGSEEVKSSPEEKTSPKDEKTSPNDEKTSPNDEKTSPEDEKTSPEDEKTSPKEEKTSPKEENPQTQQPSQQIVPAVAPTSVAKKPTETPKKPETSEPLAPINATIAVLLPSSLANGDKNLLASPQKFIAASLTSPRISKLLDYIKTNAIASDVVLIGPIDTVSNEDVQDIADNHNASFSAGFVSNDYNTTTLIDYTPTQQSQTVSDVVQK